MVEVAPIMNFTFFQNNANCERLNVTKLHSLFPLSTFQRGKCEANLNNMAQYGYIHAHYTILVNCAFNLFDCFVSDFFRRIWNVLDLLYSYTLWIVSLINNKLRPFWNDILSSLVWRAFSDKQRAQLDCFVVECHIEVYWITAIVRCLVLRLIQANERSIQRIKQYGNMMKINTQQ